MTDTRLLPGHEVFIAYHEAGHAVAAHALGAPLWKITLPPTPDGDQRQRRCAYERQHQIDLELVRSGDVAARKQAETAVLVLLAVFDSEPLALPGWMDERHMPDGLFTVWRGRHSSRTGRLVRAIMEGTGRAAGGAEWLASGDNGVVDACQEWFEDRESELMMQEKQERAVRAVAAALLRHGELSAAQVAAAIEAA